jgi:orotate phosphoribosyltransferase
MDENIQLLEQSGVVQRGHFIGTQGDVPGMGFHLAEYVDKDVATSQPAVLRKLARNIAKLVKDIKIDVVVAPAMGALGIGLMVAEELGVRYVFLENKDGGPVLNEKRASFKGLVQGANVLLVEDIINQGKTTLASLQVIKNAGGNIAAVTCIWNRSGITAADLGVTTFLPLVNEQLKRWTREECAVDGPCSRNVPVNLSPGHGKAFSKLFPDYTGKFI